MGAQRRTSSGLVGREEGRQLIASKVGYSMLFSCLQRGRFEQVLWYVLVGYIRYKLSVCQTLLLSIMAVYSIGIGMHDVKGVSTAVTILIIRTRVVKEENPLIHEIGSL